MQIKGVVKTVPINSIKPNTWNPNEQSDYIYDKEKTSIKTFGFIDPVLVRDTVNGYEIIDGEHRWLAAKDLGFTDISINNIGSVPDEVAEQLTIILNEVKGKADDKLLSKLISSILSKGVELPDLEKTLPYTFDELQHFVANATIDWDAVQPGMDQTTPTPETKEGWVTFSVTLPEAVQTKLRGQLERFKRLFVPDQNRQETTDAQSIEILVTRVETTPDTVFMDR